eukprot:752118-Prorocentrum_minimum.AAC.2
MTSTSWCVIWAFGGVLRGSRRRLGGKVKGSIGQFGGACGERPGRRNCRTPRRGQREVLGYCEGVAKRGVIWGGSCMTSGAIFDNIRVEVYTYGASVRLPAVNDWLLQASHGRMFAMNSGAMLLRNSEWTRRFLKVPVGIIGTEISHMNTQIIC